MLVNRVDVGDVILKAAGFPVNTVEELNMQLKAFAGKQILIHVNKGGKTGTTPRFVKAGSTTTEEHSEKGRKVNVIPLPKKAKAIINGQPKNSDYIFPNLIGGRDEQIGKRMGRIFKTFEEDTGRSMHLHILRHTALTQLLKYSQNIAAVSKYAGHSNIKTTEIYAHILDEQLKEITADFDFTSDESNTD